jgi:phosphatidate cytidylyltransferase
MTRLLSGVALAAAALAAILFLPVIGLRMLASLVAVLAAHEYLAITTPMRGGELRGGPLRPANLLTVLLVALACWYMLLPSVQTLVALLLAVFALLVIEVLFDGATIQEAASRFVAPWYIGMPLGMLVSVHAINGARATLLLLATVVLSDTAQYYSGRTFGRRPLAPTISPKKTIEGAIGGVVFGTLFMAVVGPRVLPALPPASMAVLGLTIVVLGICGDLFESRLKRAANIKDSSTLIPGHGGVLDRIDALLFAVPAYYLYLRS